MLLAQIECYTYSIITLLGFILNYMKKKLVWKVMSQTSYHHIPPKQYNDMIISDVRTW